MPDRALQAERVGEEVLEVRNGVVQILIAPVQTPEARGGE
jgi:hypothetical protein